MFIYAVFTVVHAQQPEFGDKIDHFWLQQSNKLQHVSFPEACFSSFLLYYLKAYGKEKGGFQKGNA